MTTKAQTENLNAEQWAILDHTAHRAPQGCYCGGGPDMQALVAAGLMKFAGRVSWVPDDYFHITPAGREMLKNKPKGKTKR